MISRPLPLRLAVALAAALAAAIFAAFAALPGGPTRAAAVEAVCPGTFHVLHNDRIGELRLRNGYYRITLLDDRTLSCEKASNLFARFLQDFDGRLPNRWKLNVRSATFFKRGGRIGFSVERVGQPSGGGGGGRHPSGRATKCPTFRVLHNDRIGRVRFPAGIYQMTALGGFSCSKASTKFAQFLEDVEGNLPGRWRLRGQTGTFLKGRSGQGFQVNLWRRT